MKLIRSVSESISYDLEFYRAFADSLDDLSDLLPQLLALKVDVLRVKVNGSEKQLFATLDEIGIPYQIYNLLYRNLIDLKTLDRVMFQIDDGFTYEEYEAGMEPRMKRLVELSIADKTWVDYNSDLVADSVTIDRELASSVKFACAHHKDRGIGKGWIIKYEDEDIGFFTGREKEDGFLGTFFGIIPEYRNRNYSKVAYAIMYTVFRDLGYRFFENNIGILNIASQRSAAAYHMAPTDLYFHVELYPFLNRSAIETRSAQLSGAHSVVELALSLWKDELRGREVVRTDHVKLADSVIHRIETAMPVNNDRCSLLLVRQYDQNQSSLVSLLYIRLR